MTNINTMTPPDVQSANIPQEMRSRNQWVVWRYEPDGNGRPTKVPYQPNGRKASSTDANTWSPFANAFDAYCNSHSNFSGVGYVFSGEPGDFVGVDLDDVRDAETGELREWRPDQRRCDRWVDDAPEPAEVISTLGSYAEVSPSLSGVKVFVRGDLAQGGKAGDFEAYSRGRYFTVTGMKLRGSPATITTVNGQLDTLAAKFLRVVPRAEGSQPAVTDDVFDIPDEHTAEDDNYLIETAVANDHDFARLWSGDETLWKGEAKKYPSQSEADQALCNRLAVRCNGSAVRVDRLFRRSGLMRDKWDRPWGASTYGRETIRKALRRHGGDHATADPDQLPNLWKAEGRTDVANAARFITMFGDGVRYCPTWDRWLHWDGRRWAVDDVRAVEHFAKDVAKAMWPQIAEAASREDTKAAFIAELSRFAKYTASDKGIRAMLSLARSTPSVIVLPEKLDSHPMLLCCENGVVNLETGVLQQHRREDYITKMVAAKFDPNATAPRWEKFIREVFEDNAELIAFMQRAAGYSLTGSTKERCLFFLHGRGRNGKSTLVTTLQEILADHATSITAEMLTVDQRKGIPTEVCDLFGVRLAVSTETEDNTRFAESLLKLLCGGTDKIKGRRLYQNPFQFDATFKLWIAGNHRPRISGQDDAVWDRVRLVPFNRRFTTPDKDLPAKLLAERDGILAWAVRGALDWQANGLGEPQIVTEATSSYRDENDVLGHFIAACCVTGPTFKVRAGDLFAAYRRWATASGEFAMSQVKFGTAMSERVEKQKNDGVWYVGIGLKGGESDEF